MPNAIPSAVVNIAGVIDLAEAELLAACGATHLGFPLRLAKHREDLSDAEAAAIVRAFGPPLEFLLITYLDRAAEIIALCRTLGIDYVQLHGHIESVELERLREQWPELRIIKSLIVRGDNPAELEQEIARTAPWVDGYITDTFDPATGATGATGKVHDWAVSRRLVEVSPHPLILAGGLNPDNVRQAIIEVRPAAVDVHTGIEGPDGRKDPELTRRFLAEARAGFREIGLGSGDG